MNSEINPTSFDIRNLILHIPNFLDKEKCNYLINYHENNSHLAKSEESSRSEDNLLENSTFKAVHVTDEKCEAYKIIHSSTEEIINLYHEYLNEFEMFHVAFRAKLKFPYKHRILKYETGSKIHSHIDHSPNTFGSCTFNLNDNYTGGEFAFFRNKYRIKLSRGDALIFPADYFWTHEVLPIETGTRYSVNTFLLDVPNFFKNKIHEYINFLYTMYPSHLEKRFKVPGSY